MINGPNLYKDIYPNRYLQNKINNINLPKKFISIHIRSTDRVVKFKNILSQIQLKDMIIDFHLKNFPLIVTDLNFKSIQIVKIYISSDQEYLKNQIIKKLTNKILMYFIIIMFIKIQIIEELKEMIFCRFILYVKK